MGWELVTKNSPMGRIASLDRCDHVGDRAVRVAAPVVQAAVVDSCFVEELLELLVVLPGVERASGRENATW